MLIIYAIKTKDCYYITENPNTDVWGDSSLHKYLFDGMNLTRSFHKNWYICKDIPQRITTIQPAKDGSYEFMLVDVTLVSDKIPMTLDPDDVFDYDNDGDPYWKSEYAHLKSLYKKEYEKIPEQIIEHEFEFKIILEVDKIDSPVTISYPIRGKYNEEQHTVNSDVEKQLISKIMFPTIVQHQLSCRISSRQMYQIVRRHVQLNIDPKCAVITSDYDFCFDVKKRVKIKPYQYTHKEFTFSKRKKSKYITDTIEYKNVDCFEMTNDKDLYKGYTPIEGIEAKSEKDLKNKIDKYLNDLMVVINEPMIECEHCNGVGYIKGEKHATREKNPS